MEFKTAITEDLDLLLTLENKYFINPWTDTQFKYELEENEFSKTILLFDDNKNYIGYINYWIIFDRGEINKICIDELYRRKGYATELLTYAFKDFQKNDCLSVSLEVRASNKNAIALYEKFGFTKVRVKEKYYSDGEDAFIMIKGVY